MEKVKHVPYVPERTDLREFTIRALILGIIMSVILGAANAYLGLKAGMTIAATYPAAVIGMAILRIFKGSILEENIARTAGSVGESVAAGAIFTLPAFVLAGVWLNFGGNLHYFEATAIMIVGSILGVFFITLIRRTMVEDTELPYPESVAAGEIHKAGRAGGTGAKYLFGAIFFGAVIQFLSAIKLFAPTWERFVTFTKTGINLVSGKGDLYTRVGTGGGALITTPAVSPAYIGVGYIIGPRLAALNFSGGLLAWGLFVPLLLFFVGPSLEPLVAQTGQPVTWTALAYAVWKFIVRPIAIGGMLVSAGYTLYRMRKNLFGGLSRSIKDVRKAAQTGVEQSRLEKDMRHKWVFPGLLLTAIAMGFLYYYFSNNLFVAIIATIVLMTAAFFFSAVSGYLVGMIGSSNNPISGLTISTLIIAAVLMVILGAKGTEGILTVLGVAAVVCVTAAVAGDMLQDLKVGYILGGTPWKMQTAELISAVFASLVMFFPLLILHQGDINMGGQGFGGKALPAPQAGLMAMLAKGIVEGQMAWPLIVVGMLMAIGMICMQVKSPMLVSVGMYLPFETTSTIFVGGLIRGVVDMMGKTKKFNDSQKIRVENNGILIAAGLIAGEALLGLVLASLAFFNIMLPSVFEEPTFIIGLIVFALIAFVLIRYPLKNAGRPDEPAPPSAMV